MGNSLVSRKYGRSNRDGVIDIAEMANVNVGVPAPTIFDLVDVEMGDPAATDSSHSEWMRVLQRVPPGLREKNKAAYDPSIVSLGPYHHGQPQVLEFEDLKDELVNIMLKADHRRQLRDNILERIGDIRHFYGGLSREECDDEKLAKMMLRDACVVLYVVETIAVQENRKEKGLFLVQENPKEKGLFLVQENRKEKGLFLLRRLGAFQWNLMAVDAMYKLENQIPWWLINSLIKSAYNKEEGEALMRRFLSFQTSGDLTKLKQLPWYQVRDEYCPLHLLEAVRITILDLDSCERLRGKSSAAAAAAAAGSFLQPGKRQFRSVTELKAKGIHFKPSSNCLRDIRFDSYYVYAVLHLPVLSVSKDDGILLSNMVALEMSPGTPCDDMTVASYLVLMKSMIEDSKDVKALQEKGIIVSFVGESEEIVRMFKEIDFHGIEYDRVFDEIKIRINEHCNSKAKTWIAELISTYFHSPWTAIALLAAAFLLCLTFLQTYFTINPKNT